MDPLYVFFIYLLVWWVVLFMMLPVGVERNEEDGKGYASGAPKAPMLKKKLVWTTIVSGIIVAMIWLLVKLDIIQWRVWFDGTGLL